MADRVRLANAQSLNLFISIYLNAFNGTAAGIETYVYNHSYNGKGSNRNIAKRINDAVAQSVGFRNRGVKENNFHVLRETVAPAVLIELDFCDSKVDMNKWNTEKIAAAMFKGITGTAYVLATPSQPTRSNKGFRVVCGTYSNRENAVAQQNKLKKAGFDSFLVAVDL